MVSTPRQFSLTKSLRQSAAGQVVLSSAAADALRRSSVWEKVRDVRSRRSSAAVEVNPLERYFHANEKRLIHKWLHYLDIYHHHFARFRGKPVTIVEFGVSHGGSLQMWKEYFGPQARIIGVDINPKCAAVAEPQVEVVIGDQGDREFLRSLAAKVGRIDVLIEDGGHTVEQQIATFEEMWPSVVDGGVFLMEDLHTNYWESHGGGLRREGTFIEYAKKLIDQQNAWHARNDDSFVVDDYSRTIRGMHVYDSIMVFDKARVPRPRTKKTGTPSF